MTMELSSLRTEQREKQGYSWLGDPDGEGSGQVVCSVRTPLAGACELTRAACAATAMNAMATTTSGASDFRLVSFIFSVIPFYVTS